MCVCMCIFVCTYIVCRRRKTIICSSKHILSESYDRLSYLLVNVCICIPLHRNDTASAYSIADRARMQGVIIVISCPFYCNISHQWMIHEVIWQFYIQHHLIMLLTCQCVCVCVCVCVCLCFGGGMALESDMQGGWDLRLSKLACYC